ncbi:SPOR domain-containing protein [Colwellia sp. E2M01]|uniref:SPOR domain-containing protein n=1 Tax=Colwellia sp. E2M01 TaxID=2841561 RepID=UPI001C09432C|nr:SPOR domain-containing protein [Colwellia sp. E2M01]MBU2870126.1 SPOR domain-containing protein [Colwellia sp. E2M01]
MANQDYISRTPPKKKPNKRRGKAAPKKAGKNTHGTPLKVKLISLLILILISAFAYGLWSLKTDPETKNPLKMPVKVKESTQTPNKEKALPAPPKEKWTYVKDLENQEIEVGEYKVEDKGPYQMQCGSFRSQEQANTLKARIAFAGIESQVRSAKGSNGTWYKVILGPYKRKREAEKDKHTLRRKSNNINGCQIWGWR